MEAEGQLQVQQGQGQSGGRRRGRRRQGKEEILHWKCRHRLGANEIEMKKCFRFTLSDVPWILLWVTKICKTFTVASVSHISESML